MASKAYTLFAADPGERTGIVRVRVGARFKPETATPNTFRILDQDVWTVREVGKHLRFALANVDLVAYETWRLYRDYALIMVGNDMQPSQVVGMIRYEAWQQGKRITSNGAHVKKVALATMPGWLTEHMALSSEQHDQDAIMHAWYVATKRYYNRNRRTK